MRKIELGHIGIAFLWMVVILILTSFPVKAQDDPITVCRNSRVDIIQIEFRNIPANWFIWNSDAPIWGYWANAVASTDDPGTLLAEALEQDTDGYLTGTVALVDYTDGWTLIGDVNTPFCDAPIPAPVQNVALNNAIPVVNTAAIVQVVSTGRTCTIQYPRIILVCG